MNKDPFEHHIETFYEPLNTQVMVDAPERIKDRVDVLRTLILNHPLPENACSHLWVTVRGDGYWFSLKESTAIGASDSNDIVLKDDYISGKHCKIEKRDRCWYLSDLESTNGVFVNGNRLNDHRLRDGDIIQLGDCSLVYVAQTDFEYPQS